MLSPLGCNHPEIVLHLDHGDSFELVKSYVDMGFSSVMIDASSKPFDDFIELTKKCVDYAHQFDVTRPRQSWVSSLVLRMRLLLRSLTIHVLRKSSSSASVLQVLSGYLYRYFSLAAYKFKPEQCTRDPKTGRLIPP